MAKISDIMLFQQSEQAALVVEVQTDMSGMAKAIGDHFLKIDSLLKEQGAITIDIPFVEYPNFETLTEQHVKMVIGFKTSEEVRGKEEIKNILIPARKIVSCLHRGTYNELAALYNEMSEWIKLNGYQTSGSSVEYYYSKPNTPEAERVTRIEMPLL